MTDKPELPEQPAVLHSCGRYIPVLGGYGETLGASVVQYPGSTAPVVVLDSMEGGGVANMFWELSPDLAVELAEQLLHHAAVARDFQARVKLMAAADPSILALDLALACQADDLAGFHDAGDMTLDDWMCVAIGLAGMFVEHLALLLGRDEAVLYLKLLRATGGTTLQRELTDGDH